MARKQFYSLIYAEDSGTELLFQAYPVEDDDEEWDVYIKIVSSQGLFDLLLHKVVPRTEAMIDLLAIFIVSDWLGYQPTQEEIDLVYEIAFRLTLAGFKQEVCNHPTFSDICMETAPVETQNPED